jgi:hypothetical protein
MNKIIDIIIDEAMENKSKQTPPGAACPGDGSVYLEGNDGVCYPGEMLVNPDV